MTTQPPTDPANPYSYQAPQPLSPSDERMWATLIHVGGILVGFWPALVGYLVLKDRGPFVRAHAVTALNFQISIAIYSLALGLLTVVTLGFGGLLFVPFGILVVIVMIMAAVAANKGEYYKYPLTIEFIS